MTEESAIEAAARLLGRAEKAAAAYITALDELVRPAMAACIASPATGPESREAMVLLQEASNSAKFSAESLAEFHEHCAKVLKGHGQTVPLSGGGNKTPPDEP